MIWVWIVAIVVWLAIGLIIVRRDRGMGGTLVMIADAGHPVIAYTVLFIQVGLWPIRRLATLVYITFCSTVLGIDA